MATNNGLNIRFPISLGGNLTTAEALTLAGAFAATFNFTAATNITFPTSGTLATTSSIASFSEVTGTSQSMANNTIYLANNAALVTLTLPTTAAVGTMISVIGKGAGGFKIAQNASQLIHLGSAVTTTGVAGSLASTNQFDSVTLYCTVADTVWTNLSAPQGSLTVV